MRQNHGSLDYFQLGRVAPRDRLREPMPKKNRWASPSRLPWSPGGDAPVPPPPAPEPRRIPLWWESPAWAAEWEAPAWAGMWESPSWALEWSEDMAARQDFQCHKGEAFALVFSPRGGAQDVSGWPLRLDISRPLALGRSGTPVLTLESGGSGIVGTALGVITASGTRAQALLLSGRYDYTLTRSDSGQVLAEGSVVFGAVARE